MNEYLSRALLRDCGIFGGRKVWIGEGDGKKKGGESNWLFRYYQHYISEFLPNIYYLECAASLQKLWE